MDFEGFGKIARLARPCVVTEKLDGTNGQVHVLEDGTVLAGSRTRYVTPENDNHGFAAWVRAHESELRELGPGRHFGEWWGLGINRAYGLKEKRFSLFNTKRWGETRPACCHVVPVLYVGPFNTAEFDFELKRLSEHGSVAAPGFMRPEGIVVFHAAAGVLFKRTVEKDEEYKGRAG